ncbi:MAG: hypothetical protein GX847_04965, partial [Clostridiales bacterium]|nr:hypothetical protein [Clostridiales bacterium]
MTRVISAEEAHIHTILDIENTCIAPPWSEGALLNELGREDGLFALAVLSGAGPEDVVLG